MFHDENTVHKLRRVSLKQPSRKIPVTQCHANALLSLISALFSIEILTTARSFCKSKHLRFLVTVNHGFCKIPPFFTVLVFRKEITVLRKCPHGFCYENSRLFPGPKYMVTIADHLFRNSLTGANWQK